jgi:hypothetical protein
VACRTEGGTAYELWFLGWQARVLRAYAMQHPEVVGDPRWTEPWDGCTLIPDVCGHCCLIHDIHYRLLRILGGAAPKSRREADDELWGCVLERAKDEDRAWCRWWWWAQAWKVWLGTRIFGGRYAR